MKMKGCGFRFTFSRNSESAKNLVTPLLGEIILIAHCHRIFKTHALETPEGDARFRGFGGGGVAIFLIFLRRDNFHFHAAVAY